ncbi:MAG: HD domain-containing protein [Candidatus Nanoarchaeia archaeon]|nr:HD domain-containing protein [Candidatus Nanoarchaeia archaeon]MDD5588349.1 HD domain-containing protein [Candidatus Nanoarchaeia archaeon]
MIANRKYLEQIASYVAFETTKQGFNPIHGFDHVKRVFENCFKIGKNYEIDSLVLGVSALLHDIHYFGTKRDNHEIKSAKKARPFLKRIQFPVQLMSKVDHCILAHRFYKGGIAPETWEAKILFDSDKLDVIGAIGLARLFKYDAKKELYELEDPFAENGRSLDDKLYVIDHIFTKAFKIVDRLYTPEAKEMAKSRMNFLELYVTQLKEELNGKHDN